MYLDGKDFPNRLKLLTEYWSTMIKTPAHKQTDPAKMPGQCVVASCYYVRDPLGGFKLSDNPGLALDSGEFIPASKINALQPPVDPKPDLTLGDYIKRLQEAYRPVPERVVVNKRLLVTAMTAIEHSNPYVASLLREALDKSEKV